MISIQNSYYHLNQIDNSVVSIFSKTSDIKFIASSLQFVFHLLQRLIEHKINMLLFVHYKSIFVDKFN